MRPSARRLQLISAALLLAACTAPADDNPSGDGAADPASNPSVMAAPSGLEDPDFAEGSINAVAFEGSYACDPGIAPEIALSDDGTTRRFSAWMDRRLFTTGTWSWDGTTLRIESTAGTFTFDTVDLGDGTMVLGTGEARWECRYLSPAEP